MPAKNSRKTYVDNSYYHLYNRGVEKRIIFQDDQDYKTFLSYLKFYLTAPLRGLAPKFYPSQELTNHSSTIQVLAYCLMPNHFHIFLKQNDAKSMTHFIQALCTRYAMYFNKRYHRVGTLYQGPYKAVLIDRELQYLYLSKYIHRNPLSLPGYNSENLFDYPYSSYRNYLGFIHQSWVKTSEIADYFSKENHHTPYQTFVEESKELSTEIETLGNITLDHDT